MAERRVSVKFSAEIQNFKAAMAEAAAATKKVKDAAEDAAKSTDGKLAESAKRNTESWNTAGTSMLGFGAAALAGVGVAIKSFADFDKQMSSVKAATHATGGEMAQLRELAISAGADTAFSAREAAQGIEELSKAGVSTTDIIGGGLAGALALAAAGELEVGEAAETAASAMTQFGLKGKDIPHIADLLAAGAGKAQGSVQDMGSALNQAGLIAAQTGLTIEETAGGLAAFASAGLTGSDAGTSFKTMLQALTPNSEKAATAMAELGISAYDSQGNFVGLSEFAGQLKSSLSGLTEQQRNSTLETIFGSDAVRAAAVLYKQGAEGIEQWEDAVNSAGYAAETARLKQDNLAGDIEKLGGSIDSVFLKSASGANGVLRDMARGAENLVDAIGKIPAPVLQTGLGLAAVAGSAALAGGAFLTFFPKVMETRAAFQTLTADSPQLAGALGKVGKAATIAAGAFVGLQIVGAISKAMGPAAKSTEEYGQAFLALDKSTSNLDSLTTNLGGLGTQIHGVGDAMARRADFNWFDELNNGLGDLVGGTSKTQEVRDSIIKLDETLAGIATNGGAEKAADSFKILAEQADKSAKANGEHGVSLQESLDIMPEYKEALLAQATAAGVTLTQQELLDLAVGKIPPSMQAAAEATASAGTSAERAAAQTEAITKALEDVGLAANGAITDIERFTQSLFNAGLLSLSASGAAIQYQAAIDNLTTSIATNGTTLDINTEQGRANQTAFNGIASAAIAAAGATATETFATHGATAAQAQLQGALQGSYNDLVAAAGQLGITGAAADEMARKALGIPNEVPIDTWVNDHATAKLNSIRGNADSLNGKRVNIYINTHESITRHLTEKGAADLNAAQNGGATGGRVDDLMGLAGGGKVPGRPPVRPGVDNVLALVNGKPLKVRSGEWIINEPMSKKHDRTLAAINAGTFQEAPGFVGGGVPGRLYAAQGAARPAQSGGSIQAAVAAALSGWQPVVNLGGREFYGAMVHATDTVGKRK